MTGVIGDLNSEKGLCSNALGCLVFLATHFKLHLMQRNIHYSAH